MTKQFERDGFNSPYESERARMLAEQMAVTFDPRIDQLVALFKALDERGKTTTLAMLAVAVKLHPKGE